jgi:hypothetical protein
MSDVPKTGLMKFYKTAAAAQFKFLPPKYKRVTSQNGQVKDVLDNEGAVLLEVAPGNGQKENTQWDWSKKISFAISFADIISLTETLDKSLGQRGRNRLRGPDEASTRIYHQYDEKPKTIQFEPGSGDYVYTWKLTVAEGEGTARRAVMVPLSDGEHAMIMRVLSSLAPKLLGLE